jgi:hypothetical protein
MRNRLPYLLLLIGILIVAIAPRIALGTDFVTGTAMGIGIGLELVAVLLLAKRLRCRSAA